MQRIFKNGVKFPNDPITAKIFIDDLKAIISFNLNIPKELTDDIITTLFFHKN